MRQDNNCAQPIKILIISIFLYGNIIAPQMVSATTCTPPTTPVCYTTITSQPVPVGEERGVVVFQTTQKKVKVSCGNDPTYNFHLYLYNQCVAGNSNHPSCVAPVPNGCTTQNQVGALTVQQNLNGMGGSAAGTGAIQACQDQVTQYQQAVAEYNGCLSQPGPSDSNPGPTYSTPALDELDARVKQQCVATYGDHAFLNKDHCSCANGYVLNQAETQCVPIGSECQFGRDTNGSCLTLEQKILSWCKDEHGSPQVDLVNHTCNLKCDIGYAWGKTSQACVAYDQSCQELHSDPNAKGNISDTTGKLIACACKDGYVKDNQTKICSPATKQETTLQPTATKPAEAPKKHGPDTQKISGRGSVSTTSITRDETSQNLSSSSDATTSSNGWYEQVKQHSQEAQSEPVRTESIFTKIKNFPKVTWSWLTSFFH